MPAPNKSELLILKTLWAKSPLSAREIHEAVQEETKWRMNTTRTVLTRMEDKEWVAREDSHGLAVYRPNLDKVSVFGSMLQELGRKVFEIQGDLPVAAFAKSPLLDENELAELEAIVNAAKDDEADQ